jgi:methionine-rich copper-binding protein CopC
VKRFLAGLLLAAGVMLGLAGPAFAHNVLVGSDPKDGTSLEVGPSTVSLTFDLPIQQGDFDVITVNGPNSTRWEAGPAKVDSNVISASVRPLGAAGVYTVGYRILSADGHPVSGSVKFTLTKAGNGTPATATAAADPQSSSGSGSGSVPVWPWIVGGVVLLGVGVFVALRMGRVPEDSSK